MTTAPPPVTRPAAASVHPIVTLRAAVAQQAADLDQEERRLRERLERCLFGRGAPPPSPRL